NAPSFGLLFNVFATTPTKGDQTLFARWDGSKKLGVRLAIDRESRLVAEMGDGSGALAQLALSRALPARPWTTVGLGIAGGVMPLMMKPVDPFGFHGEPTGASSAGLPLGDRLAMLPLSFAAHWTGRDAAPKMAGFFNGRLESPVMLARPP